MERDEVVGAPAAQRAGRLMASLAAELAHGTTGVAFIYTALDRLVVDHGLDDALIVVDTAVVGRQVFRVGRRAVRGPWATWRACGAPGLYTVPAVVPPEVADPLVHLCTVALRLDLLAHDATHDALTGLLNRRSFDDLLARAVSRSVRYGWACTLVILDVNRFKQLNDRFGHPAGDEVLRAVGRGLLASLRTGDVAARIGGDEFAVILDATDEATEADVGSGLAGRLAAAAGSLLGWTEVSFAVGSASAPAEAAEAARLIEVADQRLYAAKADR